MHNLRVEKFIVQVYGLFIFHKGRLLDIIYPCILSLWKMKWEIERRGCKMTVIAILLITNIFRDKDARTKVVTMDTPGRHSRYIWDQCLREIYWMSNPHGNLLYCYSKCHRNLAGWCDMLHKTESAWWLLIPYHLFHIGAYAITTPSVGHYNDVIMSVMASQITSLTIVYSTVYSRWRSKKIWKLRVTSLCEGNSPVTREFPAQRANKAENVFIRWRHHVHKIYLTSNPHGNLLYCYGKCHRDLAGWCDKPHKTESAWRLLIPYYLCHIRAHAITIPSNGHYYDVMMGTMASRIISLMIVYATVYSRRGSKKIWKIRVSGLTNSSVTGEFPAQRVSNAENVSIRWRHHVRKIYSTSNPHGNLLYCYGKCHRNLAGWCDKPHKTESAWRLLIPYYLCHIRAYAITIPSVGHYNDVMMSAMASQITSLTIVYSTVYSRRISKKISKLRVTGLCEGNSPVIAQKASNAENVCIWWRHYGSKYIILGFRSRILGNTTQPGGGIAAYTSHKSRIHQILTSFIHSNISHCNVLCTWRRSSIHWCIDCNNNYN